MTSVDPPPASSEVSTALPTNTDTPQSIEAIVSDTQPSEDLTKSQQKTLENAEILDSNLSPPLDEEATTQPQELPTPSAHTDPSENKPKEATPLPEPIPTPTEDVAQANNSNVGQEDRIDIFTSGMDDDQEFPNTDGLNLKAKETPLEEGSISLDKSKTGQSLEFSDKENKHDTKSLLASLSKGSGSTRDKIIGTSKHKEHHTHKDLREILTKNSVATNKNRDYDSHRSKKTSRSGIEKVSISRDRESNQRRRRMYQEIKNTLTASTSSGFGHHEIDPEREWENKKREREMQRIEVERARRELDSRRRQDSLSSQRNANGLKKSSISSLLPESRSVGSFSIEGGDLRDIPIPPVVPPQPSEVPGTRLARVQNLVRPFTQTQLKSMLELYGPLVMTSDTTHHFFWTDKNKTQCCCIYLSIDSCEKARTALHGARWPSINPKTLNFTFLTIGQFNELTGLGVNNEILDKYKQEIVKSEPAPLVERPKEQDNLKERRERVKDRLQEKEKTKEKDTRELREKKKSKSVHVREPTQAKKPTTSTSDEKKHLQSKDHSSSLKDQHYSQRDHHTSQKDRTTQKEHTSQKDHSSQKDHVSSKKDPIPSKDRPSTKEHVISKDHTSKVHHSSSKDHQITSKDHTATQKDHSSSSKEHTVTQKDHYPSSKEHTTQKEHYPSSKEHTTQKEHYPSSKDHTTQKEHYPSSKDHTTQKEHYSSSKDHTTQKEHYSSSKDHTTQKEHYPSSKDHTTQKDHHPSLRDNYTSPKVKEPTKLEAKSKQSESAPKTPKQIKLDKPEVVEKKVTTKRPASTRPSSPPVAKKPRESKGTPDSDVESEIYQSSGQAALLDTLFRKTIAEPCIYWLPLTDKQIKTKIARQKMRSKRHSSPEPDRRSKRKYSRSPRRHKRK